jgi:predicted DNA repair protein MutK
MPGASLFAVIDDIASVLDDVAALTKVATKKTAGVLGDDLALNAQQVAGVRAERELPVVWAVAKGSLVNKAILVPAALGISALAPWAITPLLMAGGTFLCFEGCEKLFHKSSHDDDADEHATESQRLLQAQAENVDLVALEATKIKGAIRTDFVLSAEIVTIALGTVAESTFQVRVAVLCGLSVVMTVGVYGLVAGIVKLDDLGLYLRRLGARGGSALATVKTRLGSAILIAAPLLMRGLSIAGTIAMFLVGGGILAHALHSVVELVQQQAEALRATPVVGGLLAFMLPLLFELVVGFVAGMVALGCWSLLQRLRRKSPSPTS